MTKKQKQAQERESAIEKLRSWLTPGDTVYLILRHVSRSGMQREIGVVLIERDEQGQLIDTHPNHLVAKVLGERVGKRGDGVIVHGCGMDMGCDLVQRLSYYLFPDGFGCIGENCPSNDHPNGDRDYTPHSQEHPHWHKSGDYALHYRWLCFTIAGCERK